MTVDTLKKNTVGRCTRCNNGFLIDADGFSVPCVCMDVFRYLYRLQRAWIPVAYWQLGLDELTVSLKYKELIRTFLRNYRQALSEGLGLLFLGNNGIGKTTLMAEVGKHLATVDLRVRYFTVQQYMNDKFSEEPINLQEYDVLLVDELDKAYAKPGSDWLSKTFEELTRQILSNNKVVVMAANANAEEIKRLFGNSTFSAIKRKIKIVHMAGKDHSDQLQSDWDSILESRFDYMHPNIVRLANWQSGQ